MTWILIFTDTFLVHEPCHLLSWAAIMSEVPRIMKSVLFFCFVFWKITAIFVTIIDGCSFQTVAYVFPITEYQPHLKLIVHCHFYPFLYQRCKYMYGDAVHQKQVYSTYQEDTWASCPLINLSVFRVQRVREWGTKPCTGIRAEGQKRTALLVLPIYTFTIPTPRYITICYRGLTKRSLLLSSCGHKPNCQETSPSCFDLDASPTIAMAVNNINLKPHTLL